MKKAIEKLRAAYPKLTVRAFPGFGHGDIINHPPLLASELTQCLRRKATAGHSLFRGGETMVLFIPKKALYCCALAVVLLTLAAVAPRPAAPASSDAAAASHTTPVLDAGHGGEDGGAVSDSGAAESGINLQIARRLYEILRLLGHPSVMTRTGDEAVYDDSAVTLREKKVSDLKNRTALANETPDGLLISIHQNSLPGHPEVRGAQVFYNAVPPSQALAQAVQQALNDTVNEGREKAAKPIGDGVYLMSHTTCPAILVECGFLSNPEEAALLQQPAYQVKIAAVIAAAYCQYCTNEGIT